MGVTFVGRDLADRYMKRNLLGNSQRCVCLVVQERLHPTLRHMGHPAHLTRNKIGKSVEILETLAVSMSQSFARVSAPEDLLSFDDVRVMSVLCRRHSQAWVA